MKLKEFSRQYLPEFLDLTNSDTVSAEYDRIAERPVETLEQLKEFIAHWDELDTHIDDHSSRQYVAMTCDTTDKEAEQAYLSIVENIMPIVKKCNFALKEKLVASPVIDQLDSHYDVFRMLVKNAIEIFRPENVPLSTEDEKLSQQYQKITGSWLVDWEGEQLTVQQVRAKMDETDRSLRERAFRSSFAPHLTDYDNLNDLYDKMMVNRQQMAANAGFENYRDYSFKRLSRFSYTSEDCFAFHDAIKATIVPVVNALSQQRREKLGLDSLRPWDGEVDEDGLEPVRPFKTGAELEEKVHAVFKKADPELGEYFGLMREKKLLDLESRIGKAPGGYMTSFSATRLPFIFMNAVGTRRDVETLLHEGGHSMNLFLCREISPADYLTPPMDFAEVASMAMEFLGQPFYDLIYEAKDIPRVKRQQLAAYVRFLPFMAMIDRFQHWVYTTENNDAKARGEYWSNLEDEFRPHIDWSGLEEYKRMGWQYLHVFQVPFYYVEYGIALLGALQVWQNSLNDYTEAIANYKKALALGGSRPLPELFATAGAKFDMTEAVLGPLSRTIKTELDV